VSACTNEDIHFLLVVVGSRDELIRQLFQIVTDGKGRLSSHHLRRFAEYAGFKASDGQWLGHWQSSSKNTTGAATWLWG